MTDNTEALPPLPEKRWAGFCSKCHSTTQFQKRPNTKAAPCGRCGYATFCEELDYSDDEMRTYARAALAQRQQVPEARMRETLEFIAQHFSSDWPERCQSHVLAARHCLTAAPSAQAELRMIECPGCGMEFADGALHNANLELHRLKNAAQEAPAIRLALDSSLVAARKALEGKSGVDFLEGWVEFVAILRAAPPAAQAEPQVPPKA